ncbi:MAG: BsuBI/PstI family type II restriction endonuclease [Pyrinomonadaceae bacterium]
MHEHITEALRLLELLGLPSSQINARSALTLLALVDVTPDKTWIQATAPLIGITPIMKWCETNYDSKYAPNSRETFRRFTVHQFIQAGIVLYNPDDSTRPVNSPKAVYQIEPAALKLVKSFDSKEWEKNLAEYSSQQESLRDRYAMVRAGEGIPLEIEDGTTVLLSTGKHSKLIIAIIKEFGPRFVPGGDLVYVGDTGNKWGYFNENLLKSLGVQVDPHGKMPDVIIYHSERNWLILAEAVTSHGPVDGKRKVELEEMFTASTAGLVLVSAFPDRTTMARYLGEIAWETEVWSSDAPSHLIHFNGERFLGPY